jgi:enoyl-CoA hydratase
VFEPDVFMDETIKIAKLIASKGPQAIKKLKLAVREGVEMPLSDGEKLEAREFGTLFGEGKEGKEGMSAFLEKRKPEW